MIVRGIDSDGDWLYGKGKNDYVSQNDAIAQMLRTRLRSFLGDCFFDLEAGIDWFNLNGAKNQLSIILAVKTVILNTEGVTGIIDVSTVLFNNRNLSLNYSVTTVFAGVLTGTIGLLLDELGDFLTTEGGDHLHA